jgi:hypothetical protein
VGDILPRAYFVFLQAKKFPAGIVPPATSTALGIVDLVQPESDIRERRLTSKLVSVFFVTHSRLESPESDSFY